MHRSDFIFISVFSLALCGHAVSTDSTKGQFPKILQQSTPQNGTIEIQTTSNRDPETKPLKKDGDSSPKDRTFIELKQNDSEIKRTTVETNNDTTSRPPIYLDIKDSQEKSINSFPKTRVNDESKNIEADALNKFKIKLKLDKIKAELKEKAETAAKKNSFPKYLEKNDESKTITPNITVDGSNKPKKYMPFAKNSKEARDNVKRKQILEWFYNARPLLDNETRLWENMKPEKSIESDKDHKKKTELQTKEESRRSNKDHRKKVEFHTVETESLEQTLANKKRSYTKMTADTASVSEELTTKVAKVAKDDPSESDSGMGNGLKSIKSKKVSKAKMANKENTDVTTEESIESVLEKKQTSEKQKTDEKTIQRFAPMKDGSSSSESASIS